MSIPEEIIKCGLPNLVEDQRVNLLKHLQSLGIETKEDFLWLKEEDLSSHLKLIQARRFIEWCKNGSYY